MTDLPPPSRDLPPGVHFALRARVLDGTYEDEAPNRRRWLLPAAVLVVVFGAIGVLRGGSPDPGPVATDPATPSSASASPSPTGPPPANPTSFDALWTRLTPSWLPAGLPVTLRSVSRSVESLRAGSYTGPTVVITLDPRSSRAPGLTGRDQGPGPSIDGRPSTWSESTTTNRGWLTWNWADDARATVQLLSFPDSTEDKIAIAARIATGLRPQSPTRVALPFTVEAPPYAWVVDSRVSRSGEGYGGGVGFGPTGGVLTAVEFGWLPARLAPPNLPANETVNGRDANLGLEDSVLVVSQTFGSSVATTRCTPKPGATALAARAECVELAGGVAATGDVTDPRTWSTTPVR
ncbi:hypothetical protein [Cryptosporangium japonicum]|uniref:Uncharacterized protein n=1 Tax=Cryptosporangium japonicum TaxID=80872 RepID=A0ABP3DWU1_9ACTN